MTSGVRIARVIRLGMAIKPLTVSDRSHTAAESETEENKITVMNCFGIKGNGVVFADLPKGVSSVKIFDKDDNEAQVTEIKCLDDKTVVYFLGIG